MMSKSRRKKMVITDTENKPKKHVSPHTRRNAFKLDDIEGAKAKKHMWDRKPPAEPGNTSLLLGSDKGSENGQSYPGIVNSHSQPPNKAKFERKLSYKDLTSKQ